MGNLFRQKFPPVVPPRVILNADSEAQDPHADAGKAIYRTAVVRLRKYVVPLRIVRRRPSDRLMRAHPDDDADAVRRRRTEPIAPRRRTALAPAPPRRCRGS